MYLNDGGASWTRQSGWFGTGNHCEWEGVGCLPSTNSVTDLSLEANQVSGPFPTDLSNLSGLASIGIGANALTGTIPDALCDRSTASPDELFIEGDATNCPNDFDTSIGQYLTGCCDTVEIDIDIYLSKFTTAVLGDSNCASFIGSESSVCEYMSDRADHDIFDNGFPTNFAGDVWNYLKVSRYQSAIYNYRYITSPLDNYYIGNFWLYYFAHY